MTLYIKAFLQVLGLYVFPDFKIIVEIFCTNPYRAQYIELPCWCNPKETNMAAGK